MEDHTEFIVYVKTDNVGSTCETCILVDNEELEGKTKEEKLDYVNENYEEEIRDAAMEKVEFWIEVKP